MKCNHCNNTSCNGVDCYYKDEEQMTEPKLLPPEKIYLQVEDGEYNISTTWCEHKINDSDIKYTRTDSELKKKILMQAKHDIPFYAYGDNQAACAMADRLDIIYKLCEE